MCMEYSMHSTGFNCSHTQITYKVLTSLSIVTSLCKCLNISYCRYIRKHEETSRISAYWPCCIILSKTHPTRCSLRKYINQNVPGEDAPRPPTLLCAYVQSLSPLNYIFHNMPPLLIFLNATLLSVTVTAI